MVTKVVCILAVLIIFCEAKKCEKINECEKCYKKTSCVWLRMGHNRGCFADSYALDNNGKPAGVLVNAVKVPKKDCPPLKTVNQQSDSSSATTTADSGSTGDSSSATTKADSGSTDDSSSAITTAEVGSASIVKPISTVKDLQNLLVSGYKSSMEHQLLPKHRPIVMEILSGLDHFKVTDQFELNHNSPALFDGTGTMEDFILALYDVCNIINVKDFKAQLELDPLNNAEIMETYVALFLDKRVSMLLGLMGSEVDTVFTYNLLFRLLPGEDGVLTVIEHRCTAVDDYIPGTVSVRHSGGLNLLIVGMEKDVVFRYEIWIRYDHRDSKYELEKFSVYSDGSVLSTELKTLVAERMDMIQGSIKGWFCKPRMHTDIGYDCFMHS